MLPFTPTPYYCEENIWMLLKSGALTGTEVYAVFVSNLRKAVTCCHQKSIQGNGVVVWDYHVAALECTMHEWKLWDFNTNLGVPCPAQVWLASTFNNGSVLPAFSPQFRLVTKNDYLEYFNSDRSHMKNLDGTFISLPPVWDCIGTGASNLGLFIDMKNTVYGNLFTKNEFFDFVLAN